MIGSCITVSLVPEAHGGPFVFWDDLEGACRSAAELGFDAIEIFPSDPRSIDPAETKKLLADCGLRLGAMGTGAGWVLHHLTLTGADSAVRSRAQAFVRAVIDTAGQLGAPAIIGSMQGRWQAEVSRTTALGYLSEALHALGEHATQYGVPLLYEPLNRYETNLVNRLADGVDLLGSLGTGSPGTGSQSTGNVRLLADLFHMNIEEADLPASLIAAGKHVGHIHFVDSNRRPAGYGHLDLAAIGRALRDSGYQGLASAEALSYPDPLTAARKTIEAYRRFIRGDAGS
jgi:sugar phosphate isomerase/epimerase